MTFQKSYVEDSAKYMVVLKDKTSSDMFVIEGVFRM